MGSPFEGIDIERIVKEFERVHGPEEGRAKRWFENGSIDFDQIVPSLEQSFKRNIKTHKTAATGQRQFFIAYRNLKRAVDQALEEGSFFQDFDESILPPLLDACRRGVEPREWNCLPSDFIETLAKGYYEHRRENKIAQDQFAAELTMLLGLMTLADNGRDLPSGYSYFQEARKIYKEEYGDQPGFEIFVEEKKRHQRLLSLLQYKIAGDELYDLVIEAEPEMEAQLKAFEEAYDTERGFDMPLATYDTQEYLRFCEVERQRSRAISRQRKLEV